MANGRPLPLLLLPFLLLCLDHGVLRVAAQQSLVLNTVPAALPLPEGTAAVVLKAQIAAPLGVDCVFDLTIEAGGTANGGDYLDFFSAGGTISAGNTELDITVSAVADTTFEGGGADETVVVRAAATSGCTDADTATITIRDVDLPSLTLTTADPTVDEDTAGSVTLVLGLSAVSLTDCVFDVSLGAASTATVVTDFVDFATVGAVVAAGTTSANVVVDVEDDALRDAAASETIIVTIAPTSGCDGGGDFTITVNDNEGLPAITAASQPVVDETASLVSIVMLLSPASELVCQFSVSDVGSTADVGEDYAAFDGTNKQFVAKATTSTLSIALTDDNKYEGADEQIGVQITSLTPGICSVAAGTSTVTIEDDEEEPVVTVSLSATTVAESDPDVVVTVNIATSSTLNCVVDVATAGGSAVSGVDFTAVTSTITYAPGSDGDRFVSVPITVDNTYDDGDETFVVNVVPQSGCNGGGSFTVTITDDDSIPTLSILEPAATVDENVGPLTYTASMSGASEVDCVISWSHNGVATTATAVDDFNDFAGPATIVGGGTTETITITPVNDDVFENGGTDEVIEIVVTGTSGCTGSGSVLLTIDDSTEPVLPTISFVADPTFTETDGTVNFAVELDVRTDVACEMTLAVVGGSATVTDDFSAPSATFSVPALSLSAQIPITLVSDALYENSGFDETIEYSITATSGCQGADVRGTVHVIESSPMPTLSLGADLTVSESEPTVSVVATMSTVSESDCSFDLTLDPASTATVVDDFVDFTATLTIPAGDSEGVITVTLVDDGNYDGPANEIIRVQIAGIGPGCGGVDTADFSLIDTESEPGLSLGADQTMAEESVAPVTYTVSLDHLSDDVCTFDVSTTTTTGATAAETGIDIVDYAATGLTIAAGTLSTTFQISSIDDALFDGPARESTDIVVTGTSGCGTLPPTPATATLFVTDNEPAPSLGVAVSTSTFDEAGGVDVTVTVTYTVSQGSEAACDISFAIGAGTDATVGVDFQDFTQTVTLASGATSGTFTFDLYDDSVFDNGDETLVVTGTVETSECLGVGSVAVSSQSITLQDDETVPAVSLTVPGAAMLESSTGNTIVATLDHGTDEPCVFTIGDDGNPFTLDFPADLGDFRGQQTIAVGSLDVTIPLTLVDDGVWEKEGADEEIQIELTADSPLVCTVAAGASTLSVADTGPIPVLSIDNPAVTVNEGTASVTLAVSIDNDSDTACEFSVVVNGGSSTATDPDDFSAAAIPATGSIAAFASSTTVVVPLLDDDVHENGGVAETLVLDFSNTNSGCVGTPSATISITEMDPVPTISIGNGDVTVQENPDSTVTVSLELDVASDVDCVITVTNPLETASPGDDYVAFGADYTVVSGTQAVTFDISFTNDALYEGAVAETVSVVATAASPSCQGTSSITISIQEDEPIPQVTGSVDVTVAENVGTETVTFTMDLPSTQACTVSWSNNAASSTAVAGVDFTAFDNSGDITPGPNTINVPISIADDATHDSLAQETIVVDYVAGPGCAGSGSVVITITDAQSAPVLSFSSLPQTVGEGAAAVTVGYQIDTPSELACDFAVAEVPGTATSGADFSPFGATLSIAPGGVNGNFVVNVIDDQVYEGAAGASETVDIMISPQPATACTTGGTQTLTINDDQTVPSLSLGADLTVGEDAGSVDVTITLLSASVEDCVFNLDDTPGTATEGVAGDYVDDFSSASITISAGAISATVTVTLNDDTAYEKDGVSEAFSLTASPVSGCITASSAQVFLVENEVAPVVTFGAPVTANEADGTATIALELDILSESNCVVDIVAPAPGAVGTASVGFDFTTSHYGTVTIPAGSASGNVVVTLINDDVYEVRQGGGDEIIVVAMTANSGCAPTGTGAIHIVDNDPQPIISVPAGDSTVAESSPTVTVAISMDNIADADCDLVVSLDAGLSTASVTSDFAAVATTDAIIPGETDFDLVVTLADDTVYEKGGVNEEIVILVSGSGGCGGSISTSVFLVESTPEPQLGFALGGNEQTLSEDAALAPVVFTIDQTRDSPCVVTASLGTATATLGEDFADFAGTFSVAAGDPSPTFPIALIADNVFENGQETFEVTLTGTSGCGGVVTHTVHVDDSEIVPPVVSGTETAILVQEVLTSVDVGFDLDTLMSMDCLIDVSIGAGTTATVGADFFDFTATIALPAGSQTLDTTITLSDDDDFENGGVAEIIQVEFAAQAPCTGTGVVDISIEEDDYSVEVRSVVLADTRIVAGDATPSDADGTRMTVAINETASFSVAIVNLGAALVDLSVTAISSSNPAFVVESPVAFPLGVTAAEPEAIVVEFVGLTSPGVETTTITIASDGDPSPYTFALEAQVVARPKLVVAKSAFFPDLNVALGETFVVTYTLSNPGSALLDFGVGVSSDPITLADGSGGNNTAMFALVEPPTVSTLSPGESVSFGIRFQPEAVGSYRGSFSLATNLDPADDADGIVIVRFEGDGIVESVAAFAVGSEVLAGGDVLVYDAGEIDGAVLSVDLVITSVGGQSLSLIGASVVGEDSDLVAETLEAEELPHQTSRSIAVALTLAVGEPTIGRLEVETNDVDVPVRVIEFRASSKPVLDVSVTFGATALGPDEPLVLEAVLPGTTQARGTISIANTGNVDATVESVAFGSSVEGLTLGSFENGVVLAPGASELVQITYNPTSVVPFSASVMSVVVADLDPIEFQVQTSALALKWASGSAAISRTVAEGQTFALAAVVPASVGDDVQVVSLRSVAGDAATVNTDFGLQVDRDGESLTIRVSIVDDDVEEPAETFVVQLAAGPSATIVIRASDLAEDSAAVGDDETEPVMLAATGLKPSSVRNSGKAQASVRVTVSRQDLSRASNMRVVMVEEATSDYVDPNFSVADVEDSSKLLATAGASFAIELDNGAVLSDHIEVETDYECLSDVNDVVLVLFDTTSGTWMPATLFCDSPPPSPVFDEDACSAVFTVCHLTQFAVALRSVAPSAGDGASAVDSSVDGDGGRESDLGDNLWAIIFGGVMFLLIVGVVVFAAIRYHKRKRQSQERLDAHASAIAAGAASPRSPYKSVLSPGGASASATPAYPATPAPGIPSTPGKSPHWQWVLEAQIGQRTPGPNGETQGARLQTPGAAAAPAKLALDDHEIDLGGLNDSDVSEASFARRSSSSGSSSSDDSSSSS